MWMMAGVMLAVVIALLIRTPTRKGLDSTPILSQPDEPQLSAEKIVELATQERGQVEKTLGNIELERVLKDLTLFKQVRDAAAAQLPAQKESLAPASELLAVYVCRPCFS
jgi:hypothetical protein